MARFCQGFRRLARCLLVVGCPGPAEGRGMERIMSHYSDFRRRYDREARPFLGRVRVYLSTRPTESWLFFAAGLLVASILG